MSMEAIKIDGAYVNELVDLISSCRDYGTKVDSVRFFRNGWHVTFEGISNAEAVCHDYSYGSPCFMCVHNNDWGITQSAWETIGFPWDNDDVSVHDADWVACMVARLQQGEQYNDIWEEE